MPTPAQPSQGTPALSFATPAEDAPRRSTWDVAWGFVTVVVAGNLSWIFINGSHSGSWGPIALVINLFGLIAGLLSIFGGKLGKFLRKVYWVVMPIFFITAIILGK